MKYLIIDKVYMRLYRSNKNEFVEKANLVHNNIYSYDNCVYVNSRIKVTVTCQVHGDFSVLPGNHINKKSGCPKCSAIQRGLARRLTTEEFIKKAKQMHGNRYNYSGTKVMLSCKKVSIICEQHGEFTVLPFDHLYGVNCPDCSRNGCGKINKKSKSTIYYIKILPANKYKIGITGSSVKRRFKSGKNGQQIEVLYSVEVDTGALAYRVEQQILKEHYSYLTQDHTKYLYTGNTELFDEDIFGGDYDKINAYIKRIMDDK